MIEVRATAFGREAALALRDLLRAHKRDDPLARATVLVPTNYVGVSIRRRVASGELGPVTEAGRGLVGVDLLTPYRLAELLAAGELAAQGRRPVSTPVIAAAIRAVLQQHAGIFGAVTEHPSTERALVRVHRELRDMSTAQLETLAQASHRAADVVRVHRAVRDTLADRWFDEFDLVAAATQLAARSPDRLAHLGHVVIYLPQDLTQAGGELLRTVAASQPSTALVGVTGVPRTDRAARQVAHRLGTELPPVRTVPPVADRISSVSDADDEVRHVVRRVVADLDAGVRLDRIGVLYGASEPYGRLLDEHFRAAGIERNGDAVQTLAESVVGRTALGLLALPDHGVRRAELFELLSTAPIRRTTGDSALVPVAAWERVARAAGVVGGGDEWDRRLHQYVHDLQSDFARRQRVEPDHPQLAAISRAIDQATDLTAFLDELRGHLELGHREASWSELTGWLGRLLERYLGPDDDTWPDTERLAADQMARVLERLSGLDEIEPRTTATVFRRTLELELDTGVGRVGSVGDGAFVGRVPQALGLDFDRLYVVGLAEGTFPARRRDDSLLPDHERQMLDGALELRADDVDEQHRFYLAALAGTEGTRTLVFPRGDLRRSAERVPSRWLLDTATAHAGTRVDAASLASWARDADVTWIDETPSFLAGVRGCEFPATQQEYDLASLLSHLEAGHPVHRHELTTTSTEFRRGTDLMTARASREFTRFDGNLVGLVTPAGVRADVVAPTRLEAWASCPHSYLMRSVLGVGEVETPEALLRVSALDKGDLMHAALDEFLQAREGDDLDFTDDDHASLAEIAAGLADRLEARGLVGKQIFWQRDRRDILADLDELLRQDLARERRGRLVGSEVGFGVPGASMGPVSHTLPNGKLVRFRGSIDRLERTAAGSYIVVDYKTGSDSRYRGLTQENPDLAGTKLQLPVYALAARAAAGDESAPVHAAYWFITETRGRWRWLGLDIDRSVMDRFDEAVGTIVDGIERGLFPPRPPERDNPAYIECPYCDPDGLGTSELRSQWLRKRRNPELQSYVALAEPEAALDV